ncbi:MAG: hypothetical protein RLP09_45390 [Sandaracinaceae bacterium]
MAWFGSIDAWVHTDVRGWTLAEGIGEAQNALLRPEPPRALGLTRRGTEPGARQPGRS